MKNTSKTTTNSSAAGKLYQARMGPNSNAKTPETHNLDAQTRAVRFGGKYQIAIFLTDIAIAIWFAILNLQSQASAQYCQ